MLTCEKRFKFSSVFVSTDVYLQLLFNIEELISANSGFNSGGYKSSKLSNYIAINSGNNNAGVKSWLR